VSFFEWIKPAPHQEEIKDENVLKKQYKYWRWRIFYGMYIGYIFYYLSRKSFTFAIPSLIGELGLDKGDIGFLGSILAIAYGGSKFLSGMLADRSNPRFFMSIGLILTGVLNICFGFSSSLFFFAIFWGLNGWFQGWGWPPCARLLTHWYSQTERGTWWGFWNTSHSVGGIIIPFLAAFCAQYFGWRYAMYVPGVLCIGVGLFMMNRLRDTPQSLGLPSIEKFRDDYPAATKEDDEREMPLKKILFEYVLKNKYIWILAISYFFVYVIRTAINDWSALYLCETKGYSILVANSCVVWFELGGVLGSLAAGWASDKICKGKRGPINVIFSLGVMCAIYAFWKVPLAIPAIDCALMFVIGFLVFGPQMLIGMAATEVSHKKAAGTASGFTGWVAYLGAAGAGYPLGRLTQEFGWAGCFTILALCAGVAAALLLPLWSIKTNPKYRKAEPVAASEPVQQALPPQEEPATPETQEPVVVQEVTPAEEPALVAESTDTESS
jgi:OPA family sugar phosphate sensor protein UhpC-like MFS transporter